ncbi:hypothetical protein CRUP_023590 [Coryphaenoides rupestris]|nr:hypothetical protein CRUP_023590 [Coryphaenoides rupestris]
MDSAMPSPFSEISLSSELQPGSLPPPDADDSSSDMLVIVDEPLASSAPQSRATNSPASVSGSASDNVNANCLPNVVLTPEPRREQNQTDTRRPGPSMLEDLLCESIGSDVRSDARE